MQVPLPLHFEQHNFTYIIINFYFDNLNALRKTSAGHGTSIYYNAPPFRIRYLLARVAINYSKIG